MTTTTIEQLERQIEELIRNHVAECRQRALAAMERGFAAARPKPATRPGHPRQVSPRRGPAEIRALADQLFAAVCANPGATMATLAPVVGATRRALERPVQLLRRTGRIRSAGQRHAMCYFPMTAKAGR